jgi:hypothetical protein
MQPSSTETHPSSPGQSPGQVFAAAFAAMGTAARVDFSTTITERFPGFQQRPRLAVRNLFKVAKTEQRTARYWSETRPVASGGERAAVHEEKLRPEAASEFRLDEVSLAPTNAWVQVPASLLEDPVAFATFIDFRLLVRTATAENQALVLGPRGLLETPGIRRLPAGADPISSLFAACDHVELMGGSADGITMNTTDYFRYLAPRHDVVSTLAALGIRIARTRMVPAGTIIVGDHFAGATLFDLGRSSIAFAEPPAGTFARPGLALRSEICTALTIHLPTHFFVASLV